MNYPAGNWRPAVPRPIESGQISELTERLSPIRNIKNPRPKSIFLKTLLGFSGLILGLVLPCRGQSPSVSPAAAAHFSSPLSIDQVVDRLVKRNAERANALRSYEGTRIYKLTYQGFPSNLAASMVVRMKYNAPDTKTFTVVSEKGPKWLQDQVLLRLLKSEKNAQRSNARRNVDLNQHNYNFSDLIYDPGKPGQPAADDCSYQLTVEPKTNSKYLYRGKLWVNDKDFAVCRMEVSPAKNPSFWIKSTAITHKYEKIGNFWLPQKNKSVSQIRIGGRATLTIQYLDYKIIAPPIQGQNASETQNGY